MNEQFKELLNKPVVYMTGKELLALIGVKPENENNSPQKTYAYGIRALSDAICCCQSTIYELKSSGVLDDAIVSHIGRKIVFDVEKARVLAQQFRLEQKSFKHS